MFSIWEANCLHRYTDVLPKACKSLNILCEIDKTHHHKQIITDNPNIPHAHTLAGINLSESEYKNICGVKFSKRIKFVYGFIPNNGRDENIPLIRRKISCWKKIAFMSVTAMERAYAVKNWMALTSTTHRVARPSVIHHDIRHLKRFPWP